MNYNKPVFNKMPNSQYNNISVCLDAGHASSTPGKRSPWSAYGVKPAYGFYEYEFNRDIVSRITKKLEEKGIDVFIVTPETDVDVKLSERANRANIYKSIHPEQKCIFISVHANAAGDGQSWNTAQGWSIYTTKGQNNSDKLAECIYEAAYDKLSKHGIKFRVDNRDGDHDIEENFTVIYKANMPAVLTENLFYTNEKEVQFLNMDEGREAIADLHVEGIIKYIEKYLK